MVLFVLIHLTLFVQQPFHPLANRQTACQPGTLNPQQIHPALVPFLPPNHKVVEPLALKHDRPARRQLGPNARVVRRQRTRIDPGQVSHDLLSGGGHPGPVDCEIVRAVDPLDVRAKFDSPCHVERQVRAQAAESLLGRWVDERRDLGLRGGVREVVALGVVRLLVLGGRHDEVVDVGGAQAGGIDEGVGGDGAFPPPTAAAARAGRVPHGEFPAATALAVTQGCDPDDLGPGRKRAALLLKVAQQRHHERVRVHDARRRRLQTPRLGPHRRLPRLHLGLAQPPHGDPAGQPVHAVPVHALERLALLRRLRDDPFARVAVGHAVPAAEVVQQLLAPDAEVGLEGVRAVVDARVDDLAVAGRRLLARGEVSLQEEGGGVAGGEGAGGGETYGASAYYLLIDEEEEEKVSI